MKRNREALRRLLQPGAIRDAIVVREILGPPKGLPSVMRNIEKKRDIRPNPMKNAGN